MLAYLFMFSTLLTKLIKAEVFSKGRAFLWVTSHLAYDFYEVTEFILIAPFNARN